MSVSTAVMELSPEALYDIPLVRLDGSPETMGTYRGRLVMVVNVASKCGLTPQYEGLEALYRRHRERGFTILGFPCNQFGEQEPGTSAEIAEFCDRSYGVTFPLFSRIEVNGENRHPLYQQLTQVADNAGREGDILWNFEKFLVSPGGEILARFDPRVLPEDKRIATLIEANLA